MSDSTDGREASDIFSELAPLLTEFLLARESPQTSVIVENTIALSMELETKSGNEINYARWFGDVKGYFDLVEDSETRSDISELIEEFGEAINYTERGSIPDGGDEGKGRGGGSKGNLGEDLGRR